MSTFVNYLKDGVMGRQGDKETRCHAGGGNLVAANKTLKKDALEKYDMYSKEAIVYQVVNGKNAMPEGGKTFIFRADRKPCRICFGSS